MKELWLSRLRVSRCFVFAAVVAEGEEIVQKRIASRGCLRIFHDKEKRLCRTPGRYIIPSLSVPHNLRPVGPAGDP